MTVLRPDEFDLLQGLNVRTTGLEQGCPPFNEPSSDQFQNGWDHAGPPYEQWGYRICDGQLEFKGHLLPGSSGTVAYTLPADYRIMAGNPSWPTDIVSGGGFSIARIVIDMNTGEITILFPAT